MTEAPRHKPQSYQPIRGVWITHVGNAFYAYTGQLDNVFHQLSRLNFNRVYVGVYNDGVSYSTDVSFSNPLTSLPLSSGLKEASPYVPVAAGIFTGFIKKNVWQLQSLSEIKKQIEVIENWGYGYCLFTYEYTLSFMRPATTKTKEEFFNKT